MPPTLLGSRLDRRSLLEALEGAERKLAAAPRLWQREELCSSIRAAEVILGGAPDPSSPEVAALRARIEVVRTELRRIDHAELGGLAEAWSSGRLESSRLMAELTARPRYEWDALIERLLGIHEVPAAERSREAGMIKYQATPLAAILELAGRLRPDDVLYDLGSGLGKVTLLAAFLAPARAVGVEREPAYHRIAEDRAAALHLDRARFVCADAREVDLSDGTAFYFFHPFEGPVLDEVAAHVRAVAEQRPIAVYALGRIQGWFATQAWLRPVEAVGLGAWVSTSGS